MYFQERLNSADREWKIPIETRKTSIVIVIIGFAVMTFALWRLYKHFERKYEVLRTQNGRQSHKLYQENSLWIDYKKLTTYPFAAMRCLHRLMQETT